jgi:hypothetical protein
MKTNVLTLPAVAFAMLLGIVAVVGPSSVAADRNLALTEKSRFVFTCETRERDFYNWIQTVIWKKSRPFSRNLDGAIDALVSNPNWTIRIADQTCAHDVMVRDRRDSLYFMIDDAHSEGAGTILYGR